MKSQVVAMLIISMLTTKQWEKSVGQRRRFWIQTKWYQNVQILEPSTISDRSHVAFIGHYYSLYKSSQVYIKRAQQKIKVKVGIYQ